MFSCRFNRHNHVDRGAGEIAWLDSLLVNRAYENECCVVFVKSVLFRMSFRPDMTLCLIAVEGRQSWDILAVRV